MAIPRPREAYMDGAYENLKPVLKISGEDLLKFLKFWGKF